MLRVLVLSFIIATPLLSQDLLINHKGTEYPGKLVEISGTHIYFQLQGQTTPLKLPFRSVKLVILADGSIAYDFDKMYKKPPLNGIRIAGELLAGVAGGVTVYYGFVYIFYDIIGLPVGPLLGSVIFAGCPLGVYLVGNLGNETGSLLATGLGGGLGLGGWIWLMLLGERTEVWYKLSHQLQMFSALMSQSIGATIGFNMTREYKAIPVETGLINFQDGRVSLGTPNMYLRPNPFIWGDMVQTIDLVSVRF